MLRRTLLPLLLAICSIVYLMSCFVFLQPEEAGVLERFGKPVEGKWHLESGFHLKWPWPVERVRRLPANRLLTAYVGAEMHPDEERPQFILWTRPHYLEEKSFVVASRSADGEDTVGTAFSFVVVNMPIKYTISNLRDYLYNFRDPDTMVLRIGEKVLVQALSRRELSDVLGAGRGELSSSMKADMQKEADALSLGILFKFVGLQGIHPPTEVAESFQEVVGALQEKESAILAARSFEAAAIPNAEARAGEIELQAETDRTNRIEIATATAERFTRQRLAYQAAPEVYKSEASMRVIRDKLGKARLYVIDRPDHEIFQFEFGEKILPDIFELEDPVNEGGGQ
jgi:regulator of protease activity HflC (stomatin/prohibitin superfamily)